jgi:hypothetical protein
MQCTVSQISFASTYIDYHILAQGIQIQNLTCAGWHLARQTEIESDGHATLNSEL